MSWESPLATRQFNILYLLLKACINPNWLWWLISEQNPFGTSYFESLSANLAGLLTLLSVSYQFLSGVFMGLSSLCVCKHFLHHQLWASHLLTIPLLFFHNYILAVFELYFRAYAVVKVACRFPT